MPNLTYDSKSNSKETSNRWLQKWLTLQKVPQPLHSSFKEVYWLQSMQELHKALLSLLTRSVRLLRSMISSSEQWRVVQLTVNSGRNTLECFAESTNFVMGPFVQSQWLQWCYAMWWNSTEDTALVWVVCSLDLTKTEPISTILIMMQQEFQEISSQSVLEEHLLMVYSIHNTDGIWLLMKLLS